MKNVLVILAHPEIEKSIGNKAISEAIDQLEHSEVRNLNLLYPDFNIDVEAEQEALKKAYLKIATSALKASFKPIFFPSK